MRGKPGPERQVWKRSSKPKRKFELKTVSWVVTAGRLLICPRGVSVTETNRGEIPGGDHYG